MTDTQERTKNPATYTDGLGELIRAKRLYTGLSQRGFAKQLDVDRRAYQRIENGQDSCPPGFLDAVEDVLKSFDDTVDATIDAARREIELTNAVGLLPMFSPADPRQEWERAVIARAAVDSELILPVIRV